MSACPELVTGLSLDEAHAVLEPFFLAARALFLERGLELCRRTRFFVADDMHDTPRHFAGCSADGREIVVAPELAELPYEFVVGILAHEFGHAADFLYPGEFALGRGGVVRRRRQDVDETQWLRWQRTWDARDPDVIEVTADSIAELVWGQPIRYTGPCQLQNFRIGEARPHGLR